MKFKNYLETFISVRDSLLKSTDAINQFLFNIGDLITGNEVSSFDYSSVLSNGDTCQFSYNESTKVLSIAYTNAINKQIYESTINIDDISTDMIIDSDRYITLYQVLKDQNSTAQLNGFVAQINEQMLNYGTVTIAYANALMNGLTDDGITACQQLLESIAITGDGNITQEVWASIIYNLYHPVKDEYDSKGDFILDETTYAVLSFVGSGILQIITGMSQILAIVMISVNKILGIVISLVSSIISWAMSTFVNTSYKWNANSITNYLDIPISALNLSFKQLPSDYKELLNNLSLANQLNNNDRAGRIVSPGSTMYIWRKKDQNNNQTVLINRFLDLNIHPYRYMNYIKTINGNRQVMDTLKIGSSLSGWKRMYYINKSYFEYTLQNNLPDSVFMNSQDIILSGNDDEFWAASIIVNLFCQFIYGKTTFTDANDFATSSEMVENKRDGWINFYLENTPGGATTSTIANDVEFCRVLTIDIFAWVVAYVTGDVQRTNPTNANAAYAAILNYLIFNNITEYSSTGDNTDKCLFIGTNRSNANTVIDISGSYLFLISELGTLYSEADYDNFDYYVDLCSNIPTSRMLSFPDYSNQALFSTLALVSLSLVVGAVAYYGVKYVVRKRLIRYYSNNTMKLRQLQSQYEMNPTNENFNKLYNATRNWNAVSSLFGWPKYDILNGWVNSGIGSSNSIVSSIYNDNVLSKQDSNVIYKAITGKDL